MLLEKMPYLDDPGNKESFLRRIERIYPYPTDEYHFIERAYQTAKDAFREKYREDQLTRYFEHLRVVTLIGIDHLRIIDHEVIAALLLHDIVEDISGWTVQRVKKEFGAKVAKLVAYASKPNIKDFPDKETRDKVYHRRFMTAPRKFFFIKLPDRLHNLWTLGACSRDKQERKIIETKRYYMPYAEREKILIHELEEAIARIEAMWVEQTPTNKIFCSSAQGIAI
jgi:(p)ppGpp synthase/HD superfamily hydrolase